MVIPAVRRAATYVCVAKWLAATGSARCPHRFLPAGLSQNGETPWSCSMHDISLFALCSIALGVSSAHASGTVLEAVREQPAPATSSGALAPAELEELLGPIALYPDVLLANVLAAAVYPDEVKQAASFVQSAANQELIETRSWEPPVKAVAKLQDVVRMMGEYLEWTTAVGQAYLSQAADVMAAVQSLRRKAVATGALKDSEHLDVIFEGERILIETVDREVVYVPYYEPEYVYVDYGYSDDAASALIGFGTGLVVGAILADLDCDWDDGCVDWGDVDIDIDRDVHIEHHARIGREGSAWAPNRDKQLATAKPDQRSAFRQREGASAPTSARPTSSSAGRVPQGMQRPSARPVERPMGTAGATSRPAERGAGTHRAEGKVAPVPSSTRAYSAFEGGPQTRDYSNRGASSRQNVERWGRGHGGSGALRGGGGGGRSRGGGRRG